MTTFSQETFALYIKMAAITWWVAGVAELLARVDVSNHKKHQITLKIQLWLTCLKSNRARKKALQKQGSLFLS